MTNIYTFWFWFQSTSSFLFCRKRSLKLHWKYTGKNPQWNSSTTLVKQGSNMDVQKTFKWRLLLVLRLNFPLQRTKTIKVVIQLTTNAFFWILFCKVCSLAHIILMMFVSYSCLFFIYIFVAYILFCQFIHTFLLKCYVF